MATPAAPYGGADEAARVERPWAIAVLQEQFDAIETSIDRAANATSRGEAQARGADALRAIDRHLRLEQEVLYPELETRGIDTRAARASHAALHAESQAATHGVGEAGDMLERVRAAVRAHRRSEEQTLFRQAERMPDAEMAALGLELDEVRQRMSGAYGV